MRSTARRPPFFDDPCRDRRILLLHGLFSRTETLAPAFSGPHTESTEIKRQDPSRHLGASVVTSNQTPSLSIDYFYSNVLET